MHNDTNSRTGSYGSLARFYVLERLKKVGDYTVIGGGGDYSDFQSIIKTCEELVYVFSTFNSL